MRSTDCLKCAFPRDEPKGARVCKKCGRLESQPKGMANRDPLGDRVIGDAPFDPLAAFLPPLPGEPGDVSIRPDNPSSEFLNMAAHGWSRFNTGPLGPHSDDMNDPVLAGLAAEEVPSPSIEVLMSGRALAEYPLDPIPITEPAHSPLGGSGAKRWMNCTGSTALIQQLGAQEDDSEYSREGTEAHALAAWCLENDADAATVLGRVPDMYPLVNPDDAPYVQQYIDYVRSRPGRKRFEVPFHRPELHDLYRGVVDAECTPMMGDIVLEIIDYKHGAGVYVPVVDNPQGKYYAASVIMEDESFYPDDGVVRITIVQPRLTWMDEPIRSWDTTVGEIKRWLREECLPAMNVRTQDMVLSLGEWCQFCPAKLVCRAMTELYKQFAYAADEPLAMSDEALGTEFSLVSIVKMRAKAVEQEVLRRLMEGKAVPLAQLERGKTDRVWKDENVVTSKWGAEAFEAKLRSPAQIEKLPGGKEFVAEWAYQPEGTLKAGIAGKGKAAQLPSPEERYGDAATALFANKTA